MLNFEYQWAFYLLALPLLIRWILPKARQQQAAVRVPFFDELSSLQQSPSVTINRRWLRALLMAFIWINLVTAATGPTWIGDAISLPSSGRDLLLAVDISGSMNRKDMVAQDRQVPRIVAVKIVLNDFIERRKGDRLGLILFGTNAYLQAPLTFDRTTVKQFLTEAQIGFAGEQQTAIGDAIGLAVKRLRNRPGDRHVVILLTDGANNGGAVEPLAAAKLAAHENIVIYTVGIGADEMLQAGILGTSFGSRKINPSADLDEETLKAIAEATGGEYFRARNPQELINIYRLLDSLEPVEIDEKTFRPQKSLFYWPLATAIILSLLLALGMLPWRNWLSLLASGGSKLAQADSQDANEGATQKPSSTTEKHSVGQQL